jgi:hypothetical protein
MKNLYKAALLAALGLGTIASAQAQFTYSGTPQSGGGATYNSDLILGFTSTSGTDTEFDLGTETSLVNGETWNLSSILTSYNLSTVDWGVVGTVTSGHLSYLTYDDAVYGDNLQTITTGIWTGINTANKTIYNNAFSSAGADNAATVLASSPGSWNSETVNPTLGTQYQNVNAANPNSTGEDTVDFWVQNAATGTDSEIGTFSLASDGVVTFNVAAVPEPATYGLLAGAGLLIVALRRQFSVKKA